ncbi:replication initiator protein A [Tistrella bauzanensis]
MKRPTKRTDTQIDLFVALPGTIPTYDQQDTMELPFFSLAKPTPTSRRAAIDYRATDGNTEIHINVTAPESIGIATIWDADILIWAASQLRAALDRGEATSPTIRVSLYELLRGIGRPTGGDEYRRILKALERLNATFIRTNVRSGRRRDPKGFHWLESYSAPLDENGRSLGIEFTIADWLYKGIVTDRLVLTIDRSYFQLSGGIERWLYRLIRRYSASNTQGYALPLRFLHETSGSTQRYADFAKELRRSIARQRLPGYWLDLRSQNGVGEVLYFIAREHLDVTALPAPDSDTKPTGRRRKAEAASQPALIADPQSGADRPGAERAEAERRPTASTRLAAPVLHPAATRVTTTTRPRKRPGPGEHGVSQPHHARVCTPPQGRQRIIRASTTHRRARRTSRRCGAAWLRDSRARTRCRRNRQHQPATQATCPATQGRHHRRCPDRPAPDRRSRGTKRRAESRHVGRTTRRHGGQNPDTPCQATAGRPPHRDQGAKPR